MIRLDSEARRGFPGNEFKIIMLFISEISYDLDLFARLSPNCMHTGPTHGLYYIYDIIFL